MKPLPVVCATMFFLFAAVNEAACAPVNFWSEKAVTLYEQQSYDSAAWYYEQVLFVGVVSNSAVYYNLGNSISGSKKSDLRCSTTKKRGNWRPTTRTSWRTSGSPTRFLSTASPCPSRLFSALSCSGFTRFFRFNTQLWLLFFLLLALSAPVLRRPPCVPKRPPVDHLPFLAAAACDMRAGRLGRHQDLQQRARRFRNCARSLDRRQKRAERKQAHLHRA